MTLLERFGTRICRGRHPLAQGERRPGSSWKDCFPLISTHLGEQALVVAGTEEAYG